MVPSITIVSPQLIGFNYCYPTFIILFSINHLLAHSEVDASITIVSIETIEISIEISPQLNGFNYCYPTFIILFNINPLLAHS